jgi:phosphoglycerate dehydrogenase-like enzyme
MRLLSQLHAGANELIRKRYPAVELIQVPLDGDVDVTVTGDGLVTTGDARNVVQVAARVPWVHILGTGLDRLPDEVFSVPILTCGRGAWGVPIAEFVLASMLVFEKQMPEIWLREPPEAWNSAQLGGLSGRTVGLIGFGGIGQAVARRALAFDMSVVALRRRNLPPLAGTQMVASLQDLLRVSDHLVLAAPLTPATFHLLDRPAFELVRPGLHIVNIARGRLIDEGALREALDDGRVARASLDAVYPEPLPPGHWMYTHPRVRLTAHISWSSHLGTEAAIGAMLANIGRQLAGRPLEGLVDPDERY